jgi:allophanate hydrolase subunit 1
MSVRPVGANALLLEVADPPAWHRELVRRRRSGEFQAVDIVPGARTVLIDGVPDPVRLAAAIAGWAPVDGPTAAGASTNEPGNPPPTDIVTIPVRYGGADLPYVAELWGCSVEAAVAAVADTTFTVAFCGFSPGFAYLRGTLPRVPRLATPRPRVAAGSVALADEYAGIYPTASPGGWRVIGTTDAVVFDIHTDPPVLLTPGTLVNMVPVRS